MVQLVFNGLDRIRSWNVDPSLALAIAGVYALLLIAVLVRARRNYLALPELAVRPAQSTPPDCMVIIPARNEAAFIGRAVKSLPADSVIVVDDHSTDATIAEAEKAGAGVLRTPKLSAGVFGKPLACATGAKVINSKWILYADADTWYEPGMIESAVQAAEVNDLSFLSIHLKQESEGLIETIVSPYMQAVFFSAIHPHQCPEGVFYGQCMLIRRAAHEFIGGFGNSLTFLCDDVKVALLAQRHRMKFGTARTSTLGHARSHIGWGWMWEGIRRNSYRFVLINSQHGFMLLFTALLLALWLPIAILLAAAGWAPLAILIALLPAILLIPWYGPGYAILAPVAVYVTLPVLANAFFGVVTTTHVVWKDREI